MGSSTHPEESEPVTLTQSNAEKEWLHLTVLQGRKRVVVVNSANRIRNHSVLKVECFGFITHMVPCVWINQTHWCIVDCGHPVVGYCPPSAKCIHFALSYIVMFWLFSLLLYVLLFYFSTFSTYLLPTFVLLSYYTFSCLFLLHDFLLLSINLSVRFNVFLFFCFILWLGDYND